MLGVALAASVLLIGAGKTDDQQPTFPLYVNVEQGGKPVTALSAANFRVFLDGLGREFGLEVVETPASVLLLVERGSRSYWPHIRSAIEGFVEYAPKGHWYGIVTFDRETHVVKDFTKDQSWIPRAFSVAPHSQWGEIATYDALANTVEIISQLPGRRVIVVVGAGLDTFSGNGFGDVEKALESTDVVVFSVGTGTAQIMDSTPANMFQDLEQLQARSFLRMLADKTGGEAWFPDFDAAFPRAMKQLFQDVSTQYKLVVKAAIPSDGRFHKVKVEAFTVANDKRQDFKVRVREGFRRAVDARD
jgi:VWFA-related protein